MLNRWCVIIVLIMASSLCAMDEASSSNSMELVTRVTPRSHADKSQDWLYAQLNHKICSNDPRGFEGLFNLVSEDRKSTTRANLLAFSKKQLTDYEDALERDACARCIKSTPGTIANGALTFLGLASMATGLAFAAFDGNSTTAILAPILIGMLPAAVGGAGIVYRPIFKREEQEIRNRQNIIQQILQPKHTPASVKNDQVVLDLDNSESNKDDVVINFEDKQ